MGATLMQALGRAIANVTLPYMQGSLSAFAMGTILMSSSALMAPWLQELGNHPVATAGLVGADHRVYGRLQADDLHHPARPAAATADAPPARCHRRSVGRTCGDGLSAAYDPPDRPARPANWIWPRWFHQREQCLMVRDASYH
jgi:hypothetical protein